jgi:5'-3' exonuclease
MDERQRENLRIAKSQFDDLIEDVLPGMGFKNVFDQNGYEADDLIAWIVNRFPENYVIVSSDEDLWQLLRKERGLEISQWNYKELMTEEKFTKKYGLHPRQWAEVKAIAGCSSDNVEGIRGVGEPTAVKFLNKVLKDGKAKKAIEQGQAVIDRNWNLVTLPFSGEKMICVEDIVEDELYIGEVLEVFKDYGFQSFLAEGQLSRWREIFDIKGGSRKRLKNRE